MQFYIKLGSHQFRYFPVEWRRERALLWSSVMLQDVGWRKTAEGEEEERVKLCFCYMATRMIDKVETTLKTLHKSP